METNSKSRAPYIRCMVTNSGYSIIHGPHHVAHTLTRRYLFVLFASTSLIPFRSASITSTGFFFQSASYLALHSVLSAHLIEQPNVFVFSTGTGLPSRRATMAFRVSSSIAFSYGFSISSMRPQKRSLRCESKMKT